MLVKAKISFCGKVSMGKGEVRNIEYKDILDDLLKCGYVEKVAGETPAAAATPKKKAVKPNENK